MICQACDLPLTQYDEYRVACKGGHVWTLPEYADRPLPALDAKPGSPAPVRLVKAPRFPAWLPGALLGGLALFVSLLEVVL